MLRSNPRRAHRAPSLVLLITVTVLAGFGATLADAPPEAALLRIPLPSTSDEVLELRARGFDIAGIDRKAGTLDIVGTDDDADELRSMGLSVDVVDRLDSDPPTLLALEDYWSPSEIAAQIDAWIAAYPSLIRKEQYATTEEGRPVWAVKISDNVSQEENEGVVLFVAQHHAREVMTPEIGMDLIQNLLEGYGNDPAVTAWVDDLEIWVLPNHNPDGTDHMFDVNSNWRKNRRDNGNGTFGVDLNRNYPFRWGACNGSSGSTSDDTYRGPSPASEPETFGGILELAREHRPTINLSYHTYSELVIIPYGCSGTYTPELATFRDLSAGMATKLVSDTGTHWYEPGTGWEILYAVDGEMNDWFYGELGSYGMTVEANSSTQGFRPDYATWRDSTVDRNRPGWAYVLDRMSGPGVAGNVTDACTGAPLAATTLLDDLDFVLGETPRTAEPLHGRYHWLALPGDHTVRFEQDGYTPQVRDVDVGFELATLDVGLVPTGSAGLAIQGIVIDDAASDADGEADPGEEFDLLVRLLGVGDDVTGVTATLTSDDPNVVVVDGAATYGTVNAGAIVDGDGFRVRVDGGADDGALAALTVTFAADLALCTPSEDFELRVTQGAFACPSVAEPFDVDPGWAVDNNGTGGWAFGAPQGDGAGGGPASAVTGEFVYGTNLAGNYGNGGEFVLTTGSYDLRGVRGTELRFHRWLDNEAGFDIARTEISVDGGQSWQPVWEAFEYGDGWQQKRIDIATIADLEDDVRFRFRLSSDANTTRSGFYLDDFAICGEEVPNAAGKLKYLEHALDDTDPAYGNGDGVLDDGETATIAVKLRSNRDVGATGVEAFLTTTTPGVTVRNGYARFEDVPAGGVGWSLAPDFTIEIEPGACATRVVLDLDVRWDGGSASSTFAVPVGAPVVATVFQDDLESDQGWTVGGNASAGAWVREDPNGVDDAGGTPVQPEDDTTATGTLAWVTGNPRTNGNFDPGDGDVDGGTTWLESPAFDGTDAERLDLTYNRWFVRRNPGQFDSSEFRVLVSADGGAWREVAATDGDLPQWSPTTHDLLAGNPAGTSMRVRIEVEDGTSFGGDTLVEGLIDDLRVERERLECTPFAGASSLAPNGIGTTLTVDVDGPHVRLDWQAPPADASHDPATGYVVYRSGAPDAGFAPDASPTSPFAVLADEAGIPSNAYFVVVAENAAGTSGDEPAP